MLKDPEERPDGPLNTLYEMFTGAEEGSLEYCFITARELPSGMSNVQMVSNLTKEGIELLLGDILQSDPEYDTLQ